MGTVLLSVNPEIEMDYDEAGNVVALNGLNDDGKAVLASYTGYEGKACTTVIGELVDEINAGGYFDATIDGHEKNIVLKLERGSKYPSDQFLNELAQAVRLVVEADQIGSQTVALDDDDYDDTYADKGYINAQAAQGILSTQLGRDDIQFVEKDYDLDDGEYEVEFVMDGVEYEYEVNAVTGKVTEMDADYQDYDDTDYGPQRRNHGLRIRTMAPTPTASPTTTTRTTAPTPTASPTMTTRTTAPTPTASPTTTTPTTAPTPTASRTMTTPTTAPMPTASRTMTTPTTAPTRTASPTTTTPTTAPMPTALPTTAMMTGTMTAMMIGTTAMMIGTTTMMIGTTTMTTAGTTESIRLRHELKHQISPQEDLVLAGRLRKLFRRDAHAGADGTYRITSLYFDTPYDAALREKLDGVDRREKFRLRYYGGIPPG